MKFYFCLFDYLVTLYCKAFVTFLQMGASLGLSSCSESEIRISNNAVMCQKFMPDLRK